MNTATCSPMIENYFTQLESQMADLPATQRQDFLMELRAHVMDRLEQLASPSEQDCRNVLNALGTPDEIARQYRMELLLKRSSWRSCRHVIPVPANASAIDPPQRRTCRQSSRTYVG